MASAELSEYRLEIEKLDGSEDWWEWKYSMALQLKAMKVWGHVDGTATLKSDASTADKEKFEHAAVKAQAVIVRGLTKQVTSLVLRCDGPKAVWDRLVDEFEVKSTQNTMLLRTQVNQMRLKEGGSVKEHLRAMKEVYDRLAMLDDKVSEKDQVITLLASLPPSYSALRSVLLARGPGITWTEMHQALSMEEQQRELQSTKKSLSGGENSKEKVVQGALRAEPTCWKCGRPGHFKRDCTEYTKSGNHNSQRGRGGGNRGRGHGRGRGRGRGGGTPHGAQKAGSQGDDSNGDIVFTAEIGVHSALSRPEGWLVDSGASRHMTKSRDCLINYQQFIKTEPVSLGDGKIVEALGEGDVQLELDSRKTGTLKSVLYVPRLSCNLLSVSASTDQDLTVEFDRAGCCFKNRGGQIVGTGTRANRMYELNVKSTEAARVAQSDNQLKLWHQRLGHINQASLRQMVDKKLVNGIELGQNDDLGFCQACVEGKKTREPFPVGGIHTTERLQLVHSDVCGPMQTVSHGGARYFVTFIDDFSRCVKVYCISSKDQVFEKFREFQARVTNETGLKIKTLRTDGGGEYTSAKFENFLKQKGIVHEITAPYSPQQNGVAERMNRTLVEAARSMIFNAGLSKAYWGEAVTTAAYVRNRVVTSSTGVTPYERWYGEKPDVSQLKVFGCTAYALVPEHERRKWDRKTQCLRFVGYGSTSGIKGYRLFDERRRKLVVRRDVTFDETKFNQEKETVIIKDAPAPEAEVMRPAEPVGEDHSQMKEIQSSSEDDAEPEQLQPRRSTRKTAGVPPMRYVDEFAGHSKVTEVTHAALCAAIDEPSSLQEALDSKHAAQWKAAADSEYQSLMENQTWELVKLPTNRKTVGCKWIFKVKYGAQGEVERFKSRLVAKGYSQRYGIDYDETYSPVVRLSSVRTLLANAVQKGMLVHQMDVVTAFLNGDLEEEIFMEQPEGYVQPGQEDMVCKLKKSLYGLKQSPRCWNQKFVTSVRSLGFVPSDADPCIFVKRHSDDEMSIIAVYVDDLIIMTTTVEEMQRIKASLSKNFKMKDLGSLHYCLGISVEQHEDGIKLSQKQYIEKLLERYGLQDANPVSTPMDLNVKLVANDGSNPVEVAKYQSVVGSLLYAAVATRPDISQAVGVLSRFNSAPTQTHLTAAKRVLRYLKGTVNLGLQYKEGENSEVTGYSDADWAREMDNRRSTTGNVFIMSGGPISWLSQRQSIVALSTAEAEYVALSSACQEAVWLQRLLTDIHGDVGKPITIKEDNQGAIAIAKNPVGHKRTKHIDIRYHFVREQVQKGVIEIEYLNTKEMLADLFTKPLARGQFEYLRSMIGIN